MTTPSKIDFLEDVQGTAHALLTRNFAQLYTEILTNWFTNRQELHHRYIEGAAGNPLFYGLLAFAQPDIFKALYRNHDKCLGLISGALKYMYYSPLEIADANRRLDDQIDPPDQN